MKGSFDGELTAPPELIQTRSGRQGPIQIRTSAIRTRLDHADSLAITSGPGITAQSISPPNLGRVRDIMHLEDRNIRT
ncbi:hypothetical protein E2C01_044460 [Portunus trituberculatus]|uniref:Uncharacterized protein n=1 Tax=Portunus trituberculatus TaxID=210409 RepID=A0A5B7FT79_PORTR|nr:hypothetical protein [Portunus trituberculatus]